MHRLDIGQLLDILAPIAPGEEAPAGMKVRGARVLVVDGDGEEFEKAARGFVAGGGDHARDQKSKRLKGNVQMDDAYIGGARSGRRGRGAAGKTPFVAAIATTDDGKPDQIILRPVKAFSSFAIRKLASPALNPGASIVSDGLACFAAVTQAGCLHTSIKTGSGKQAARTPAFKWVNTALGNIKAARAGTYRAVREKHVARYLAEFEYRFNRRYDLKTMIPRLAFVALRTTPMPYRLLKLADFAA